MRGLSDRGAAALAAIDAANSADPTSLPRDGVDEPLALVHGRLATAWVERLVDDPSNLLLIAARAHHLRRWELPRDRYPAGRAGYLRWRRDQKQRHAADIAVLLGSLGFDGAEITRVQQLIRRDALATDPEAQAVEDAACLVFVETQLASLAARLDHDHVVTVLRKTAQKMSPGGIAALASVDVGSVAKGLLADAFG